MKFLPSLAALALLAAPAAAQGGFLGVQLAADTEGPGAAIVGVQEGSPAEIVGLRAGDVVLVVGEQRVKNTPHLVELIGARRPGDIVTLRLRRNGEVVTQRAVLGRRPGEAPAPPPRGMRIVPSEELEGLGELGYLGEGSDLEELHEHLQALGDEGRQIIVAPRLRAHQDADDDQSFAKVVVKSEGVDAEQFLRDLNFGRGTGDGSGVQITLPASVRAEARARLSDVARSRFGPHTSVSFQGQALKAVFQAGGAGTMRFFSDDGGEFEIEVQDLDGMHWNVQGGDEDVRVIAPKLGIRERERSQGGSGVRAEPQARGRVHATGTEGGRHPDLESALGAARRSGKPVLLDFYADWCGPCRALGREVLENPAHADLLSHFEMVQVNVDDQHELADHYRVQGIPDMRILAPGGKEIARHVGYPGVEATLRRLDDGIRKAQGQDGSAVSSRGTATQQARQHAELARRRVELEARIALIQDQIQKLERELARLRAER